MWLKTKVDIAAEVGYFVDRIDSGMIAPESPRKGLPRIPAKRIPAALIYEIMDGKPVYYKGYRRH